MFGKHKLLLLLYYLRALRASAARHLFFYRSAAFASAAGSAPYACLSAPVAP